MDLSSSGSPQYPHLHHPPRQPLHFTVQGLSYMWGVPPAESPRGKGETYTVTARSPKREIGGDTPTVMAGSPKREKPKNVVTGRYRPQAVGHCWTPTFDCHTISYWIGWGDNSPTHAHGGKPRDTGAHPGCPQGHESHLGWASGPTTMSCLSVAGEAIPDSNIWAALTAAVHPDPSVGETPRYSGFAGNAASCRHL